MNVKTLFSSFIFLLISLTLYAETLCYVSIEKLIEQEIGRIVLPQIYRKVDRDIEIRPLPGRRAQYEATLETCDGEIMRIWAYGEENLSVIRIPTPYYYLETMAFVHRDSNIRISKPSDLQNYRIVRVRGVKHTNNITSDLEKVLDVEDTLTMFNMLALGRADVALTNRIDGLQVIKESGIDDIIPGSDVLARLSLYHYIRKDLDYLVKPLDDVISSMIDSGELEQVIKEAEETVLERSSTHN